MFSLRSYRTGTRIPILCKYVGILFGMHNLHSRELCHKTMQPVHLCGNFKKPRVVTCLFILIQNIHTVDQTQTDMHSIEINVDSSDIISNNEILAEDKCRKLILLWKSSSNGFMFRFILYFFYIIWVIFRLISVFETTVLLILQIDSIFLWLLLPGLIGSLMRLL